MSDDVVQVNIWGEDMPNEAPPTEYKPLQDLISFKGFDFNNYREGEKEILQPQLEALGYKVIEWKMGESDSFGPLTRICKTSQWPGAYVWFIYG